MKIITIPDLHGKDYWKKVNPENYDKIIFLGDYVDSKKQIEDKNEIRNLFEIIELKRQHSEKVILLLGNHDIQYLFYPHFTCGYINYEIRNELIQIFTENKKLFQAAYQYKNHLWTHAGVSNLWFRYYIEEKNIKGGEKSLGEYLNELLNTRPEILATVGPQRKGHSKYGGIFWADKSETENDFPEGYYQYVGHTKVPDILRNENSTGSIHFLDCLNTKITFKEIIL